MTKNYLKESEKVYSFIKEWGSEINVEFIINKYDDITLVSYVVAKKDDLMKKIKNFSNLFKEDVSIILSGKFLHHYSEINDKYHFHEDVTKTVMPHFKREVVVKFSNFNGYFNEWNFENGRYFKEMFCNSHFDKHPLFFNFKSGLVAERMFSRSKYNQPFTAINVNHLIMLGMFEDSKIKQTIDMDLSQHDLLDQDCLKRMFNSYQIKLNQLRNIKMPINANYSHLNFKRFVQCNIFDDLDDQENCDVIKTLKHLSETQDRQLLNLQFIDPNYDGVSNEFSNLIKLKSYSNLISPYNSFIERNMKLNLESYLTKIQHVMNTNYNEFIKRKNEFDGMFKVFLEFYIEEINDVELLEKYNDVLTSYNFDIDNDVDNNIEKLKSKNRKVGLFI